MLWFSLPSLIPPLPLPPFLVPFPNEANSDQRKLMGEQIQGSDNLVGLAVQVQVNQTRNRITNHLLAQCTHWTTWKRLHASWSTQHGVDDLFNLSSVIMNVDTAQLGVYFSGLGGTSFSEKTSKWRQIYTGYGTLAHTGSWDVVFA